MLLESFQRSMRQGHLCRRMAIFLLAFAFFDMAIVDTFFPQLCVDVQASHSLSSLVEPNKNTEPTEDKKVAAEFWAIGNHDSQQGQDRYPSPPDPVDEDCFCCCSHIVPSPYVNVAALNCQPQPPDLANSSLPSSPPQGTFHPPRLS
jgi:hypothetical protein